MTLKHVQTGFSQLLRAGLIVHVRDCRQRFTYGLLIRDVLGIGGQRPWGNHDALVVQSGAGPGLGIGDATLFRCRITPLEDYNRRIRSGDVQVRVYEVVNATARQEIDAATWWVRNVNGTVYDFRGILYLTFKSVFRRSRPVREWTWANWCTEGVGRAWLAAGRNVYRNVAPTPLTTERRLVGADATLRDVTQWAVDYSRPLA